MESKYSLQRKLSKLPSQLYKGFEHGAAEVNKQVTGLDQMVSEALGLNSEERKKRAIENIERLSNLQKEKESEMGTTGKVSSFATEMVPSALAGLSPLGAALMGMSMTAGDTAQQQLTKHGEINTGSSGRSGILSGMSDAAMNYATRGLSRRIPSDIDIIGRASASNAMSNQISDTMTDSTGSKGALEDENYINQLFAELRKKKGLLKD